MRPNLQRSFPDKSEQEIKQIEKKFYKHFCDIIFESIKSFSISEKEIRKRFKVKNPEVVNKFYDEGRSVILVGGHYNNWEWFGVSIDLYLKHRTKAVFFPLKNEFINHKLKSSREAYGLDMIVAKASKTVLDHKDGEPVALILGADQSPSNAKKAYWMTFLNQETGVLFGTEKYAQTFDVPVIFGAIHKVKRGHYEGEFSLLTDKPKDKAYGEITEMHTKMLEAEINKTPEFWLWTHRRWKKKRPKES